MLAVFVSASVCYTPLKQHTSAHPPLITWILTLISAFNDGIDTTVLTVRITPILYWSTLSYNTHLVSNDVLHLLMMPKDVKCD